MMKTSAAGRAAIAREEGNKLTAYKDSVGVLTIGVGHTSAAGPPVVRAGMKITAAQSDEILARDLAGVEASVNGLVRVPLAPNEFDALVSLVFNIGGHAFAMSTLLKRLNAGDRTGAADQFRVWNKGRVSGKLQVIKGLASRRERERAMFLQPAPHPLADLAAPAADEDIEDEGVIAQYGEAFDAASVTKTPSVAATAGAIAAGVSDATAPINKAIAAGQGAAQSVAATVTTVTSAAAVASSYTGFLNGISPTVLLLGFGGVLLLATVAFGAWWTFRKTFKAPPNGGAAS